MTTACSSADIAAASPDRRETIDIDTFVDAGAIGPEYFDKPYVLEPASKAEKGYVLLRDVLARTGKAGSGRVVIRTREYLAAVLPKDFPLPARYAHPVVLTRMIRVLREGRAQTADEALDVVKRDLKALTADVQVEQWEYDEVVAVKPMFLLSDYQ